MNADMCVLSLTQKNICNLTGLERYNIDIIVFHHLSIVREDENFFVNIKRYYILQ